MQVIASMHFVVKYFSEIVMKSKPVRRHFVRQLEVKLRAVLRDIDLAVVLQRRWDKLSVRSRQSDETVLARMVEGMRNTSGVIYVLEVQESPLPELDAIAERVLPVYAARLAGRSFAVRRRRSGLSLISGGFDSPVASYQTMNSR